MWLAMKSSTLTPFNLPLRLMVVPEKRLKFRPVKSVLLLHLTSRYLTVAQENVASVDASATVIEGVSRSRNVLLNNDTKNYDWDSGYTCHQLGSGAIVVQLAQPFVIGSMRYVLTTLVFL